MNAVMSAKEVLSQPSAGNHFVQVYQETETLLDAIGHYMANLNVSEAAIIIATEDHVCALTARLVSMGIPVPELIAAGRLTICNAEATLAKFMRNGKPERALFEQAVGKILENLSQNHRHIRAFGEMVDILWQGGEKQAAIQLEEYWNDLLKKHSFSLLCAYKLDNLDSVNYQGAIDYVCKSHTHFLPPQDTHRLERAVAEASHSVMGVNLASMVKSISGLGHPTTIMPPSQASLLYLSKAMPLAIDGILMQVRAILQSGKL